MNDLYSSRNIIRVIKLSRRKWAGLVALMWGRRGGYWVLVEKLEGKRPFGRFRRRWEDSITMHLQEFEWGGGHGLDCSGLG